jgi:apolipoprotein N-acyltransferase
MRRGAAWTGVLGVALVASAAMMALALQAQSPLRMLGWVTLVPLFLAIQSLRPVRAMLAGALWGASFAACAVLFGNKAFAFTPETFALLVSIPGAYAGLGSLLTRHIGFSPLLLALGWVGVEFALQPLGLHNGLLAGTQGNGLFVRTMGHLAGYVLLAFFVAYVNASILEMLTCVCRPVGGGRSVLRRTAGGGRRLLPVTIPIQVSFALCQAQPRAPPRPAEVL